MKKKIVYIFVCLIFFSSTIGTISSKKKSTETLNKMTFKRDYMHTVFLEVATSQNCIPCHNWNQNIYEAYNSGNFDFEYVEMIVFDHNGNVLNEKALDWDIKYKIGTYPTSICDGDYKRIVGNYPDLLMDTLNDCGNRTIQDIIAGITLSWLGNATIQVDITIENNK